MRERPNWPAGISTQRGIRLIPTLLYSPRIMSAPDPVRDRPRPVFPFNSVLSRWDSATPTIVAPMAIFCCRRYRAG
ncbi:hypothetical protein KCP77_05445 [Salmonella enterica subsp. enterica]|nr:hypothetical protein KCP77_05445 [Salmonella enterica subsp. enterica]